VENDIRDITDGFFYELDEIICVKCGRRWIAARPEGTLLKHLECPEGHVGFAILTGEDIDRVYDSAGKEDQDADQIIKTDECRIVAHETSAERILPFKELQKQRSP
jgi:hypothetical protein